MEMDAIDLVKQLKGLIQSIDEVNALLKVDQQHFRDNKLEMLSQNDEQKQKCIENITVQLATLQKSLPDSREHLITGIIKHIKQFNTSQQATVEGLIKLLQSKLTEGYEHLITNNDVIIMNLNYLKKLWDNLIALSPAHHAVYEKPQGLEK